MPPKQVALQQKIIHEGHEEQQRRKAAGNEGHKVGQVCERWGGKLLQVLLCCFVTGVQPAGLARCLGKKPKKALQPKFQTTFQRQLAKGVE